MKKTELTTAEFPLFKISSDPMIVLDKKGKILRVNDSALALIGHKKEFFEGKLFMQIKLLTPQSKVLAVKNFAKRMLGREIEPYEVQMYHEKGYLIDVEINAAPILDGGKIIGDLVSIRDISKRKISENELHSTLAMLDAIYQNVPVGITLIDDEGNIVKANDYFKNIVGDTELEERGLLDLPMVSGSLLEATFEDLIKNHQSFSLYDSEYSTKKEVVRFANFIGEPLKNMNGDGKDFSLVLIEDTTDLHDAHESQLQREKEIQKLKDQFVFVAAHELKTPVTAIKWGVEMLSDSGKDVPDVLRQNMEEVLENITENNNRLSKLVSELLDVARMDYGTFKIEPKNFNLSEVVEKSISTIKPLSLASGIEISFRAEDVFVAYADPERVEGVMVNLLSNAIKYNVEGGRISVDILKKGEMLEVAVEDTGIGLSKDDIEKLFERFYRVERKEVSEKAGSGLGLYIVKQIVEKMDGEITVESKGRDKGSIFRFTIPQEK